MKTIEQTIAAIDSTIAARKDQLPAIREERARIEREISNLSSVRGRIDEMLACAIDDGVRAEIESAANEISSFVSDLKNYESSLDELEAEFTRDTLNIGVSGAARTGKSTTLQHITGLTDLQIPSGGLNPVTAVRSEIYNSPRQEAVVSFKTEREFIEGYVRPHVANVNEFLQEGQRLSIGSLGALKTALLPEKLAGSPSTAATDSLKRLREAQRSAATYEGYLGAAEKTVRLDDVRAYVTYPEAGLENLEAMGGAAADRRYLAVKLVREYCQFPNLGAAKVGLVDLPGLGEIGNSASEVHLKGLESRVDQIFLVMRPTAAKAFADSEVACNLDQLDGIQPAVRRGDLVIAGINKDAEAGQVAADNLRAHFEAEINAGRADGGYEIVDYCAIDDADVANMFGTLLDRLGRLLPKMDAQKVSYCMGGVDLSVQVSEMAERLVRAMDRVLRSIPSSDRVMKRRIDTIERAVIGELSAYAVELGEEARADSEAFKAFVADAEAIHDDVAVHIADGLFRADAAEWLELTSSSRDFYNLYRDECKRIRYEIIDAYCELDRFYGTYVSDFKMRVLDTVLRSCGMDRFFGFSALASADERIAKVASELGSTLRDDDLDSALRLLASMRFDFRSNVFLQIEGHLAELANPAEEYVLGKGYSAKTANKRVVLGGSSSDSNKQEKLAEYLRHDASKANDAILAALKGEQDRFNKYLAVSIDFFNNYLFGKDEDNFKQVVIRGLIREYKPWVLPDADDASKSPLGIAASEVKEAALALTDAKRPAIAGPSKTHVQHGSANSESPRISKKVDGFRKGQMLSGKVTKVENGGAYVSVGHHYGFVPKGQIAHEWVDDATAFLKKGQTVRVKVIKIDRDRDRLILSIKQCAS